MGVPAHIIYGVPAHIIYGVPAHIIHYGFDLGILLTSAFLDPV